MPSSAGELSFFPSPHTRQLQDWGAGDGGGIQGWGPPEPAQLCRGVAVSHTEQPQSLALQGGKGCGLQNLEGFGGRSEESEREREMGWAKLEPLSSTLGSEEGLAASWPGNFCRGPKDFPQVSRLSGTWMTNKCSYGPKKRRQKREGVKHQREGRSQRGVSFLCIWLQKAVGKQKMVFQELMWQGRYFSSDLNRWFPLYIPLGALGLT